VDLYDYLAEIKGQSREWSLQMHESVVQMAKGVGLDYNFDIAKIGNSFDAHRMIQLAKANGLGDEMEERFFKAYFTEGALMSDPKTLERLAIDIGLDQEEVRNVLNSDRYAKAVEKDIAESRSIGVRGVPFFVMDRKYAVSGAQAPDVFLGALQQSYAAWRAENPVEEVEIEDGAVCRPDGECD
jgi:protein disulfide-isomerase